MPIEERKELFVKTESGALRSYSGMDEDTVKALLAELKENYNFITKDEHAVEIEAAEQRSEARRLAASKVAPS